MRSVIYSIVLLVIFPLINAATFTKLWVGGTGTWGTSANWSPSGVPTSTDVVLINSTDAQVTLSGSATVSGVTLGFSKSSCLYESIFTLSGTFLIALIYNQGSLTVTGNISIANCGTLQLLGGVITTPTLTSQGYIEGNGVIHGNLLNLSPGVLYPGGYDLTARNITLVGNYTQGSGARFTALIRGKPNGQGSTEPLSNDYFRVNGSASINGSLVLTVDQRYTSYYSGVSITIFSFFSITGNWASRSTVTICVTSCSSTSTSGLTSGHLKTSGRETVQKTGETSSSSSTTGSTTSYDCGSYGASGYAVLISGSTCPCSPGWSGTGCNTPVCPGNCNSHGVCTASQPTPYCTCDSGWKSSDCSVADCPGTPDCNYHGNCLVLGGTPTCNCSAGWTDSQCSTPQCPGTPTCSGFGSCYAGGDTPICSCDRNHTGSDCSITRISCAVSCIEGNCNYSTGMCDCHVGWTGSDCSVADCPGSPDCNNQGSCHVNGSLVSCICNDFYSGTACEKKSSCDCSGNGNCYWNGSSALCACFAGWSGSKCSVASCPGNCSNHGNCYTGTSTPMCNCTKGWDGLACNISLSGCPGTPQCSGNGVCTNNTCTCNSGYLGSNCGIPNCPGTPDCNRQGLCLDDATCSCFDGYQGTDCNGTLYCPGNCTGDHGVCIYNVTEAYCQCDANWAGKDCSVAICANNCSGNGICNGETNPPHCVCNYGYNLGDCSQFNADCPSNCSSNGICSQNGTCECAQGWTGIACEIADCLGTPDCFGHGACINKNHTNICSCDSNWSGQDCSIGICLNNCNGNGECDSTSSSPVCICDAQFFGSDCSQSLKAVSPYDNQPESGVFHVDSSHIFSVGYLAAIFVGAAIVIVAGVIVMYHFRRRRYQRLLQSQLSSGNSKSSVSLEEVK